MALPKKHRLKSLNNFVSSKRTNSPLFNLLVKEQSKEKRFAFVVGTKISKKAVERNKIKRRLSGAVQMLLPKIKPGDYIIYAKKEILGKEREGIKNELEKIFKNNNDSTNN